MSCKVSINSLPCTVSIKSLPIWETMTAEPQGLTSHSKSFNRQSPRKARRPRAARICSLLSERKAYSPRAARARWIPCASVRGSSRSSHPQFLAWRQPRARSKPSSPSPQALAPSPTRRRKRFHRDQRCSTVHTSTTTSRRLSLQPRAEAQHPPTLNRISS